VDAAEAGAETESLTDRAEIEEINSKRISNDPIDSNCEAKKEKGSSVSSGSNGRGAFG
jgi:hypothetical protein